MSKNDKICGGRLRLWGHAAALVATLALLGPAQAQIFPGSNFGPIPDGTGPGPMAYGAPRDIRFNVSGLAGSVGSARVFFRANHSWVGDLKVQLIAPDGRAHLLFERTGATTPTSGGFNSNLVDSVQYLFGDDFPPLTGTNWWTAADIGENDIGPASLFTTVVSGGDGVANPAPTTSMNAGFGTADPNGTWILRFEDGWSGDTGEVIDAELILPTAGIDHVVSNANNSGSGSLREALSQAQPGDAIRFSNFFDIPRTINLQTGLQLLPDGVGIFGPGPRRLTVRRDSAQEFRIFGLLSNRQATISGMTIADGSLPVGTGGGIVSRGRMTVVGSVVRDNLAEVGGGIAALDGTMTLLRTTLVGNSATDGAGVFAATSSLLIDNSTISAQAGGDRVGVTVRADDNAASLVLRNSTVTDTGGGTGAGLLLISLDGSGLASARISNSLLATGNPTIATTVIGGGSPPIVISEGYNLATDDGGGLLDQPSDRLNAIAALLPLQDNGGGIPVHRPLLQSDALDNGRATGPRISDATGIFQRVNDLDDLPFPNAPGGDGSDIGAFELLSESIDVIFADGLEGDFPFRFLDD